MDPPVEEAELPPINSTPESRPVRRRLVQSTIFNIGPREAGKEGRVGGAVEEDDDSEAEEHCGSQNNGKRRRPGKGNSVAHKKSDARPGENPELVEVVDASLSARRPVRRKLIQSTLRPHRSEEDEKEGEGDEEDEYSEEEYCGSQEKKKPKKRARKPKTSQRRATNKVANGKEQDEKMNHADGPETAVSERRRGQRRQQKEKQCVDSPENDLNCSPVDSIADTRSPRRSKKRHLKGTPVKNVTSPLQNKNALLIVPDLRLEAKKTAEENSRIFAGKQIHPFFSSRKSSKKETSELEADSSLVTRIDKCVPFGPIHVFESFQDQVLSLDWSDWMFCDGNLFKASSGPEGPSLSVFEDCVEFLNFDNVRSTDFSGKPSPKEEFLPNQSKTNLETILQKASRDEQMACCAAPKDVNMDQVNFSSVHSHSLNPSDVDQQIIPPQRRIMCRDNQPENSLWTNKYLPEKAMEVCGNRDSVKYLSDWLRLWHGKESHMTKRGDGDDECLEQDIYFDDGSECDSENINGDAKLQNVLLVTGPVGSGKSAAIYACAKEQGFQVLELNASDWRNGALVKLKIGEALESHSLKWSLENSSGQQRKQFVNSFPNEAIFSNAASEVLENEVIDLINLSDGEDTEGAVGTSEENRICCRDDKTLLLFEDVNITSSEDRGFVAAIQQLAETAKQPIILTSNSDSPFLPENLRRLHLSFDMPSPKELLCHVTMVCAAEKADIQPHLIAEFVRRCHGDIRKTIMNVQFWCQGVNRQSADSEGNEVQKAYSPLLFDIDAGHEVLPKIIPWGFPSQLSEVVEKEISNSLSMFGEVSDVIQVGRKRDELDDDEPQEPTEMLKNSKDSIEVKKAAMLSRNYPVHDGNEYPAFGIACEYSGLSDSPVAFTRRNVRKKLETVLSSDSEDGIPEDGILDDRVPVIMADPSVNTINELNPEFISKSPSHCFDRHDSPSPSTSQPFHDNRAEQELQFEGMENTRCISDTCKAVDFSCVPELSFVPETEIFDGKEFVSATVFSGSYSDLLEADSASNVLIQNHTPYETTGHDKLGPGLLHDHSELLRTPSDVNSDSIDREVVGDSNNDAMDVVTRRYQMWDESSRMDFSEKPKFIESQRSCFVTDSIQRTWRELRSSERDLRHYVTPVDNDSLKSVKLAYKLSDLISEADILLSDCQDLLCDVVEPPAIVHEDTHAFFWDDAQMHMASTVAQHGFCFYAKHVAAVQSKLNTKPGVDLIPEMLASTMNTMALGKLIGQNMRTSRFPCAGINLEMEQPANGNSLNCEMMACLRDIVESVVPLKSHLAMKGGLHEYLSSMGQISSSETSRITESMRKMSNRRRRRAQHYLSNGSMMLSPADISLLGQYSDRWKNSLVVNLDRT